jgi:hypothetical protein
MSTACKKLVLLSLTLLMDNAIAHKKTIQQATSATYYFTYANAVTCQISENAMATLLHFDKKILASFLMMFL